KRPAPFLLLARPPSSWWEPRWPPKAAIASLGGAVPRREKRKGLVDKIAAQIMLQHYLDAHGS
ncbi:MAG TPA: Holliday junction resolvase RuvX, partial [Kiritimatiellia bacterium]|nr:Holliday junction resolvase RuvX [Kiritimatiellia bacterium]